MPRVSATSAPTRQGITSLAAPEPVLCDGRGASAPGCAVIFVSPCQALCVGRSLRRGGSAAPSAVVQSPPPWWWPPPLSPPPPPLPPPPPPPLPAGAAGG